MGGGVAWVTAIGAAQYMGEAEVCGEITDVEMVLGNVYNWSRLAILKDVKTRGLMFCEWVLVGNHAVHGLEVRLRKIDLARRDDVKAQ